MTGTAWTFMLIVWVIILGGVGISLNKIVNNPGK